MFKNSHFQFTFERGDFINSSMIYYWPGKDQIMDRFGPLSWDSCIAKFYEWLHNLQREVTAPNLWERFQSSVSNIQLSNNDDNSKFTHQEYLDLSSKIDILINAVPSINLLENQTIAIQSQLVDLLSKTNSLGKYDWRNLFVGTMISIIIQLGVTQDNANELWILVKQIFSNYFIE